MDVKEEIFAEIFTKCLRDYLWWLMIFSELIFLCYINLSVYSFALLFHISKTRGPEESDFIVVII